MKNLSQIRSLLKPISDLQKLMEKSGCPWMIIGGVAAGILGKPRFTADVDVVTLIKDENIPNVLKLAKQLGFTPRIKDALAFAKKNRVLLLQHEKSSIGIDISLGFLPFEEEAIKRSVSRRIGNVTFRLPAPEDLIIFKAVAHRAQDILDIREIVERNPKVNKKYIKKIVREFTRALDMPEIWSDIEDIFK